VVRLVRLSDEAAESLGDVERWYSQPGAGAAAARRVQAILAAIAGLSDFPYMGRAGDIEGTRELTCQGHRIIYVVAGGADGSSAAGDIVVLDIFGPGQSRSK
jgi:plasmid stabilization system protein ParE